jgi:hypothetical protein
MWHHYECSTGCHSLSPYIFRRHPQQTDFCTGTATPHLTARQELTIHYGRARSPTAAGSPSRRATTRLFFNSHSPRTQWREAYARANTTDSNATASRGTETRNNGSRIRGKTAAASHGPATGANAGATACSAAAHPTRPPQTRSHCRCQLAEVAGPKAEDSCAR